MPKKILLDKVTLISASSIHIEDTLSALKYSMRKINFAAAKIVTHEKPKNLPNGIEYAHCSQIKSLNEYSKFMMYDLIDHVDTEYCLTVQQDGFVVNPHLWDPVFLEYDYIGAPWPIDPAFVDPYGEMMRVGNGGFSFRSRKLLEVARQENIPFTSRSGDLNEDVMIGCEYRKVYEKCGCRFAPLEIAIKFAREFSIPEANGVIPFGFHKYRKNNKFYPKFPTPFQKIVRTLGLQ